MILTSKRRPLAYAARNWAAQRTVSVERMQLIDIDRPGVCTRCTSSGAPRLEAAACLAHRARRIGPVEAFGAALLTHKPTFCFRPTRHHALKQVRAACAEISRALAQPHRNTLRRGGLRPRSQGRGPSARTNARLQVSSKPVSPCCWQGRRFCPANDVALAIHHADVRLFHSDVQIREAHGHPPVELPDPIPSVRRRAAVPLPHVASPVDPPRWTRRHYLSPSPSVMRRVFALKVK
jgi:hypothetical protein